MKLSLVRMLSTLERAKLVCWFEETQCFTMTARRFRAEFGHDPPSLAEIKAMHKKFLETGSIVAQDATFDPDAFKSPPLEDLQEEFRQKETHKYDPMDTATFEQMGIEPPPLTRRPPVV